MDHHCDFDDHIGGKTTSDQEDHQGQLISQVVMKTFRDHSSRLTIAITMDHEDLHGIMKITMDREDHIVGWPCIIDLQDDQRSARLFWTLTITGSDWERSAEFTCVFSQESFVNWWHVHHELLIQLIQSAKYSGKSI